MLELEFGEPPVRNGQVQLLLIRHSQFDELERIETHLLESFLPDLLLQALLEYALALQHADRVFGLAIILLAAGRFESLSGCQ